MKSRTLGTGQTLTVFCSETSRGYLMWGYEVVSPDGNRNDIRGGFATEDQANSAGELAAKRAASPIQPFHITVAPSIPEGEIRFVSGGEVVGRITNIGTDTDAKGESR